MDIVNIHSLSSIRTKAIFSIGPSRLWDRDKVP